MAAVTICNDFGAPQNKVWHCFHCFPIYFPWSDGTWFGISLYISLHFCIIIENFLKKLFNKLLLRVKILELTWERNSAQQIFLCIVLLENIVFYLLSSCEIDTHVYVHTPPLCNLRHCKFWGHKLSCLQLYLSHCKITLTVINSSGNWQAFEKW